MTITSATLHYFDIEGKPSTSALGENLHLILKDSGIEFTYHRHKRPEWLAIKEEHLKSKDNFLPTLPFVEIDGKVFNKTQPTMRYVSKKLGKYLASNDEDQYLIEAVADTVRDHYGTTMTVYRCVDNEKLKEHYENNTVKYLKAYDQAYSLREGVYLLGEKITYADFLVYHIIQDDSALQHVKEYPNLAKFVDAFTQRPNLADYIASLKQ